MESLNNKVWLNTEEAALYLSTTRKGILNRVHRGDLPAHKMGRLNRYKRIELDQLIEHGPISNKRREVK